jgi:energy-coupling factor transport system substrate-specific component
MIAVLGFSIIPGSPFVDINWALLSIIMISLAILIFFIRFEQKSVNSKEVALIATMASIAGVSRIPFAMFVNVQPTTFIVMITGYVMGPQTGFIVGAVAALVSNFFLGQGPWTPWQMFSWGICGVIGGLMSRMSKSFNLPIFALVCGFGGYLFGWLMNIWHWMGFVYPLSLKTFLATYVASFPFDTIHMIGNLIISIAFGKSFYNILIRFKKKIYTEYIG